MLIYEEEGERKPWIRDSFDVRNVLKNGDLQALVGKPPEFDVSIPYPSLRPSHDRRFARRFEVEAFAKMMPVRVRFLILISTAHAQ